MDHRDTVFSLQGWSMGGQGALLLAFKHRANHPASHLKHAYFLALDVFIVSGFKSATRAYMMNILACFWPNIKDSRYLSVIRARSSSAHVLLGNRHGARA